MSDFRPPIKPSTPIGNDEDNVFTLIANARKLARMLSWPDTWIEEFTARVTKTESYEEALAVLREHFTIEES